MMFGKISFIVYVFFLLFCNTLTHTKKTEIIYGNDQTNKKIIKFMKINSDIDDTTIIQIRGKNYPVTIAGNGIPIISIGIGVLGQRTLSEQFKQHFKVYSSNLYWVKECALEDFQTLTIEQIIDDIAELGKHLNLPKFCIFGHSAFGIVALEVAKKYPNLISGIILSGTPLNSNPEVAVINNAYFEEHADLNRKMIDAQRREQFSQEILTNLNFSERFLRKYIWMDAPRYWYIPDFNCSAVWEDIIVDDVINHFFTTIMPSVDVRKNLEKVACPIFLAAGDSDYDCCPWVWNTVENLPKNMIISHFKKSGHWPHYEEQALFDQRIKNWAMQIK